MNKLFPTVFVLLISLSTFSQVGIGTTAPDPSTALDISSGNKGILMPRVKLLTTTTTQLDGVNTAATGLLIYNDNPAITGIGANGVGYYYFDGTNWIPFIAGATDDKVYGEVHRTTSSFGISTGSALSFNESGPSKSTTLSSTGVTTGKAGIYRVTYTVSVEQISSGGSIEVEFYLLQNGTEVPGTRVYADVSVNPDFVTASRSILIDVASANQTFTIRPSLTSSNIEVLSGTALTVELID